jgi:hypothetical protein
MKIKDLEQAAMEELKEEQETMVKEELKERIREIRATEKVLGKLKTKYQDLLERDFDEF